MMIITSWNQGFFFEFCRQTSEWEQYLAQFYYRLDMKVEKNLRFLLYIWLLVMGT
jgi:hypothetical protein